VVRPIDRDDVVSVHHRVAATQVLELLELTLEITLKRIDIPIPKEVAVRCRSAVLHDDLQVVQPVPTLLYSRRRVF